MDCIVHGLLQARILEWVVFPLSRGSSQPRDRTQVSALQTDYLPAGPPGKPPKMHLDLCKYGFAPLKGIVPMWALPSHLWDCPSLSPPLLLPQLLGRGRPRGAQGRGRLKRRSGASPRAAEPAGRSSSCECLRRGLRANKAAGWGGAGQRPKKCGRAGCSCAVWRADYSMASPKRFPTLVQLEQREGTLFEVLGNLTKRPYWFHSEYLKSPKAVHLEAWLVEAIFGEWAREGKPRQPLGPGVAASSAGLSCGPGCSSAPLLPPPLSPPLLTTSLLPAQAGVENTSLTSSVCHRPCFTFISGIRTARLKS